VYRLIVELSTQARDLVSRDLRGSVGAPRRLQLLSALPWARPRAAWT